MTISSALLQVYAWCKKLKFPAYEVIYKKKHLDGFLFVVQEIADESRVHVFLVSYAGIVELTCQIDFTQIEKKRAVDILLQNIDSAYIDQMVEGLNEYLSCGGCIH